MLWVLLAISLPRVYVGGHYPVDVLASIFLTAIAIWTARLICSNPRTSALFERIISKKMLLESFLFLWLFELAEGFRSSYSVATYVVHVVRSLSQ